MDKIIINNSYIDNGTSSPVKLEEEIKNKIKNKKENNYVYKFTSFYSIRSINQLESIKEGPQFYRVPKNNSLIKNEYEFDVIKYFNNTCVSPNNRTLLYIQLFSEFNEKNENDFIEKAKKITENFVNKIMSDMKEDILKNYNNEEFKNKCNFSRMKIKEEVDKMKEEEEKIKKEEEEKKKKEGNQEEIKKEGSQEEAKKEEEEEKEKVEGAVYIPPKRPKTPPKIEEISLNPEIILKYEYNQKIEISDYFLENNENNIIFTKNNSLSNDLDEYFEESFNILQQNKLVKEEKEEDIKKEKEEVREVEDEDEIEDNNLIDELFNEIEMNEEKKEEKEEKKDEKKEEKTSENKEEEKKEIEKEAKEKKEEEKTSEQKEEDKKE